MARRSYKNPSVVSGMSVSDILGMDNQVFNELSESDLRKVVGRLVSAGNKRLRSFERADEYSPAVRAVERSGGAFSTKGKDLNGLRAEYARAKAFMESKTGTRKGWTETKRETINGLKEKGIKVTDSQFNNMWQSYEQLKELSPEVANRGLKYAVLKEIADMMEENDGENAGEIALRIHDSLDQIYEEQAEMMNNGVSDFFEI